MVTYSCSSNRGVVSHGNVGTSVCDENGSICDRNVMEIDGNVLEIDENRVKMDENMEVLWPIFSERLLPRF